MRVAALVCVIATVVSGCGGGSGGNATPGFNDDGSGGMGPSENPSEGLPNFAITDFVTASSFVFGSQDFSFSVSIVNTGTVEADVPSGWIMESISDDFSTGFMRTRMNLVKRSDAGSNTLGPGEEAVFVPALPRGLYIPANEDHYVKFWLNPDTGVYFETSEPMVMEQREIQELSYDDNVSDIRAVSIETPNPDLTCEDEPLEENDTLETAPLISLGVSYELTNCFDVLDILAVELTEGNSYEITSTGSIGWTNISTLTVIRPTGDYLLQEAGIGTVLSALETGVHRIAVLVGSRAQNSGTVSIRAL